MKKVEITRWLVSSLLLLLVLPWTAAADEPIAEVENLGDTLVFHPVTQFHELILTVTGPCGFEYRQVVAEGEPFFRLDETTIDGAYRYNLFRTESVDPGVVKILKQARANLDDETPKQLCRDGKLPAAPQVQSAGFQVIQGKIVYDPSAFEKSFGDMDVSVEEMAAMKPDVTATGGTGGAALPTKDFVINDDLIVDGSACIGFDCVNGEVFSFDTIRLKENNLRIKFDDTSVVPSFPANDWQLTANESANGGASKFSIEDVSGSRTPFTVEANARSHSLYVDDGGRIGSRTSTPSVEIHTIDGDTPTLRLQQDGSSGFEPQTWDVAGNETNFFIRDVTNGSALPFRIRPSAPSNSIFIDVDGVVGLGTSSPAGDGMHVSRSTGGAAELLRLTNNGGSFITFENTSSNDDWFFTAQNANEGDFIIDSQVEGAGDGPEFSLDVDGNLEISGALTTTGATCNVTPCDGVFAPDYQLPSIDEHVGFMWENSYLPAVGPTPADQPMNISQKMAGVLNELETAHIYIGQLHDTIKELEARLEKLETEE